MPKNKKPTGNLGRDEEINAEELVRRYAALKRFLEDNWGRIGQKLPRARSPEAVKATLNLVRNAKWHPAFRDFPPGCLLLDGTAKVGWRELRKTREQFKETQTVEGRLSSEFHNADQTAHNARVAFDAAVAEQQSQQQSKQTQRRLKELAKQLNIEELRTEANEIGAALNAARSRREALASLLESQQAWFARNEVAAFVGDPERRYRKTPANFAMAMAGLPFYDWLYSVRKCSSIPEVAKVPITPWFQVFNILRTIVKRTKSASLRKIELRLKRELLKEDTDHLFRSYISPQWHYMTCAFADCRGKKFRPRDIPYRIMARFLDHYEVPSSAEAELAKHNQLLEPDSR